MEHVIKYSPLEVGSGAVDLVGVKAKHLGFFVEVLKYRQRVIEELDLSILYNMDVDVDLHHEEDRTV